MTDLLWYTRAVADIRWAAYDEMTFDIVSVGRSLGVLVSRMEGWSGIDGVGSFGIVVFENIGVME